MPQVNAGKADREKQLAEQTQARRIDNVSLALTLRCHALCTADLFMSGETRIGIVFFEHNCPDNSLNGKHISCQSQGPSCTIQAVPSFIYLLYGADRRPE